MRKHHFVFFSFLSRRNIVLRKKQKNNAKLLKVPKGEYLINKEEKSNILLSLVVPTLEEKENIVILLERLMVLLDSKIPNQYEIIVVDDDSDDRTWQKVAKIANDYRQIKIMRRTSEKGMATAVIRGWQVAKGKYLGVMAGDFQHPLEPLLQMLSMIETDADVVVASRYVRDSKFMGIRLQRRLISKSARILGCLILPKVARKIKDPLSGYFLVKREVLNGITLHPLGHKILLEVLARGRVNKVAEIGYVFGARQKGVRKAKSKSYMQYVLHLFKLQITSWPLPRIGKWVLVGISGFAVDMFMFFILLQFTNLPLTLSAFLSAEIAIINNFFWNDRWTFGDLASKEPPLPFLYKKGMRFWKFNMICLSGLILHTLIVRWFVFDYDFDPYVAKVITIIIVSIWNIILNFRFSWNVPSQHEEISRKD